MPITQSYFEEPETGFRQYRASFVGGDIEYGEFSFSGASTTSLVQTYLAKIYSAIITPTEEYAGSDMCYCGLTITSVSNWAYVTVNRVAGTTSALTYSYIFIGHT